MSQEITYKKVEVDNSVCFRRFHIAYEEGTPCLDKVEIRCPHCQVVVFEKNNHPYTELIREENLVVQPDGSRPLVNECHFPKS